MIPRNSDWQQDGSTTDWTFFSIPHIQDALGWTSGRLCHEARGAEKLCELRVHFIFVFIPRAHSGSKKRDIFSILYFPQPVIWQVGTLPSNNYIPDSP